MRQTHTHTWVFGQWQLAKKKIGLIDWRWLGVGVGIRVFLLDIWITITQQHMHGGATSFAHVFGGRV